MCTQATGNGAWRESAGTRRSRRGHESQRRGVRLSFDDESATRLVFVQPMETQSQYVQMTKYICFCVYCYTDSRVGRSGHYPSGQVLDLVSVWPYNN